MAGLIDKSLLLRAETSVATRPLYQMLETVRAFAALELTAAGERDDALEGLVRYCTGEAALAAEGLFGPAQAEWLDRVRDDLESYRGALSVAGRARPPCRRGPHRVGTDVLLGDPRARGRRASVVRAGSESAVPSARSRVESAGWRGHDVVLAGRARARHASRSRAPSTSPTAPATRKWSRRLSISWVTSNMPLATRPWLALDLACSVEGFRTLGISWGVGNSLNGIAKVALSVGDAAEAERLLDEATSVLRRAGPWFLALVSFRRATLAVQRGTPDQAIALVRESLTLFRQLHDKFAIVYALVPLAAAAALKGDDAWAARILGAGDAITERTGATVVDQWVRAIRELAEREVRARLGQDRWALAYAAGRGLSIDSLMNDIDRFLSTRARP